MKVSELIEALGKFDPEAEVSARSYSGTFRNTGVTVRISKRINKTANVVAIEGSCLDRVESEG